MPPSPLIVPGQWYAFIKVLAQPWPYFAAICCASRTTGQPQVGAHSATMIYKTFPIFSPSSQRTCLGHKAMSGIGIHQGSLVACELVRLGGIGHTNCIVLVP